MFLLADVAQKGRGKAETEELSAVKHPQTEADFLLPRPIHVM